MVCYPEIDTFSTSNPEVAPASHSKLTAFFLRQAKDLQLELATINGGGEGGSIL